MQKSRCLLNVLPLSYLLFNVTLKIHNRNCFAAIVIHSPLSPPSLSLSLSLSPSLSLSRFVTLRIICKRIHSHSTCENVQYNVFYQMSVLFFTVDWVSVYIYIYVIFLLIVLRYCVIQRNRFFMCNVNGILYPNHVIPRGSCNYLWTHVAF